MKLTGSSTENEYRDDLINSRRFLFESDRGKRVLDALRRIVGKCDSAYVLTHTPEQSEDVFRILVGDCHVFGFEYVRESGSIENLVKFTVKEYEKAVGSSKEAKLNLAIALDLAKGFGNERA